MQFADALLGEAVAFAGDAKTSGEIADRLLAAPDTGLLLPLLHRLKAFALAQGDDPDGAERELHAAAAAARAQHQPYETLVALDALGALGRLDAAGDAQRGALRTELSVTRLARPPLAAPRAGGSDRAGAAEPAAPVS